MPYTRTQALERLAWMVASDQYPQLDSTALQQLVDDHARWSVWTASTAYVVGDIVIPTVANGRLYQCVIAGTSSATEPQFPQWTQTLNYSSAWFNGDYKQNLREAQMAKMRRALQMVRVLPGDRVLEDRKSVV